MLSKKDAKDRVQQIKSTMAHLIGVPVLVRLGPHEFNMVIDSFELATIAQLAMQPDKVYNELTGKQATPQVAQLLFKTGESINITLDHIADLSIGVNGAVFKGGQEEVKITYDRTNS